jgi:hypothetical protein
MRKRKHLETRFYKFLLERLDQIEDEEEIQDEETNLSNDEIIDEIDNIKEPIEKPQRKIKEDEDLDLDELIEEYNRLTEKYKTMKNDTLYKRR